ncbi:hypothetical protein SELR_pSRC102510 (plasmid) [Selenomonas ruminantium subsp. lactilytica TAM6421]|uniref:Uncharacterized protein n=2 Tax=Selenomonas ruminantium TaxID=971 RepID=I0GWC1_SELRL|nr:hypothetical protein SELR_pSRC102510 [Selenomonas ruminantium subsp. lactilytica TAM6421]
MTSLLMAGILCLGAYGFVDSGFGKWISAPFVTSSQQKPPQDGSNRKKHQPRPFDPLRLGKAMAELSAMLYLGAYVVRKRNK